MLAPIKLKEWVDNFTFIEVRKMNKVNKLNGINQSIPNWNMNLVQGVINQTLLLINKRVN